MSNAKAHFPARGRHPGVNNESASEDFSMADNAVIETVNVGVGARLDHKKSRTCCQRCRARRVKTYLPFCFIQSFVYRGSILTLLDSFCCVKL